MEVHWRDNFLCPTEDEYLDMINKSKLFPNFCLIKFLMFDFLETGSTCESISKTLEVLSPITDLHLRNVSILLGLYFQISDDYNGLTSEIVSNFY